MAYVVRAKTANPEAPGLNVYPSSKFFVKLLRKNFYTFTAVALSAFVFAMVWSQMGSNVFPPGDDPGNWLKRVNALAGKTYPLWDESILSYPPFFFVICHAISTILGDSLVALKLAAALAFSAIPLTTYTLSRKMAGSPMAGLASALIVAFFPAHYEMLWWGAYPNLLAVALMPIALLALFEAQGGSLRYLCLAIIFGALLLTAHHLTFIVYVASLVMVTLASVVERDRKSLWVNMLTLAVILALSVFYWYLVGSAYVLQNPLIWRPGALTIDSLLWLFKDPFLLYLTLAMSIAGLAQLFFDGRFKGLTLTLGWLMASLLLTQVHYLGVSIEHVRFLFLMVIPLSILASAPLTHVRRCVGISKVFGENPAYDVEIQVKKAIAVVMLLIVLLVTPLQGLNTSGRAYAHYIWASRYGDQERLQVLDWIRQNTSQEATVVSDFHLGRWVEGYAERRALFPMPPESIYVRSEFERFQVADAIMGSSHQLANEYVKLDEWQPVSNEFSPLISLSWGARYAELIYINDAFVRVNLTRDGKTWIEAPYNAWLYQSKWLERSSESARLQLLFRTMGLLIEKVLHMQAGQPEAVITYRVEPKRDVTLNTLSMNVYLMWGRTLHQAEVNENRATLITDAGGVELSFMGNLLKLEVGKDEEFNQDRVQAQFRAEPNRAEIGVIVTVLNPQSSWMRGVWAASSSELEREYGVTHIAIPKASHAAQRFKAGLPEGPVVYVDDAFARMILTEGERQWTEAPYKARVLSEETKALGEAKVFVTSYETIGLYIDKTIVQRSSSLEVRYGVKAKEGVLLQRFQLSVWLAWGRTVSDAEVQGGKMLLVTDAGALEIAPAGKVLEVAYGLDEEFRVPRILINYALKSEQDEVSLTVTSLNEGSTVEAQVDATTRPFMEASDKTMILIKARHYREVFRGSEVVIYEAPKHSLTSSN